MTPSPASPGMSPGLAPLPPIPSFPRGGEPSGGLGAPDTARGGLKQLISGLAPVSKHVGDIQKSLMALGKTGLIDPGIITQLRVLTGALIPMALQGALSPAGSQAGAPPLVGQSGMGGDQGSALPAPGPPGAPGGPQPMSSAPVGGAGGGGGPQ